MAKYRVTLRASSVEGVEADNPYMAAIFAAEHHGVGGLGGLGSQMSARTQPITA